MPLTTVTITGADDATDPEELRRLSASYPFVEWGILVGSHFGSRFPRVEWIDLLVEERVNSGNTMKLSLHVCGKLLRGIACGEPTLDEFLGPKLTAFSRVQLNWHGEQQSLGVGENVLSAFLKMDVFGWDPTIIFQLDGVNDGLWEPAGRKFACAGLFDRSHGAGVCPGEWPNASPDIQSGWAGGLGPDNLEAEIPRIDQKAFPARDYWIDMETKVRTSILRQERLDLSKVEESLLICSGFVGVTAK